MTVHERPDLPGVYVVFYTVDLREPYAPTCDCKAGCLDRTCHHVTAAQAYRDGEPFTETL